MPRSLVVGNGHLLAGYDSTFSLRDLYWPRVGDANQTMGNLSRTGIWVDGAFAWLNAEGWERDFGYEYGGLVANVRLRHPELGVELACGDFVDMARDWLIRPLQVRAEREVKDVRVFFHYDWYIGRSDLGNTVLWDPKHRAVLAYKDEAYFLLGGEVQGRQGCDSWATGKKGQDRAGTWMDAQDGSLGRNPIEQGAVDCVVEFDLGALSPAEPGRLNHWVCAGRNLSEVTHFGQQLIRERGADSYHRRTLRYWQVWSDKGHETHSLIQDSLGAAAHDLFRECALLARAHCDAEGGVIAATDFDITKFARDTYAYVWPRDGAIVAHALDCAGHQEVSRRFFLFCRRALTEEGFLLHKYNPGGMPGSSWHPWVDARGERVLPIQEDETGLVLWALWEHYRMHRSLDFVADLYTTLVVPSARWMAGYLDPESSLPLPSWDLWEERWGVHAFTVGAVWAGLKAAHNFAELFGDAEFADQVLDAARRLKAASDAHLYRAELGRFARRLTREDGGEWVADQVLDSALYGLWRFGMYPADDPRIVATMEAVETQLANRAEAGGWARYANDYYFQAEHDLNLTPGNPWFICSMWVAQWRAQRARTPVELEGVREVIDWVLAHQMPGGVLSEQLDPHQGSPLSVSPLTWSQAEFMITVDDYLRRARHVGRAATPPA